MAQSNRTRGPAATKFKRAATSGPAHDERVKFGKTWGAYNAEAARRLRGKQK